MKIISLFLTFYLVLPILAEDKNSPGLTPNKKSFEQRYQELQNSDGSLGTKLKYEKVNQLWFEISDQLKNYIRNPEELSKRKKENFDKKDLEDWQRNIAMRFQLLKKVSRLRANLLRKIEGKSIFSLEENSINTMAQELSIIPYKFIAYLYEKSYWFFDNVNRGVVGIFHLIWEILLFLAMLLVPFIFFRLSKKVDQAIDKQKRKSFYVSFKSSWHRNLIPFLSVISVYVPWVFSIFAVQLLSNLLAVSEFSEFDVVLPYAFFYIYYKIFRVTLEIGLHEFALKIPVHARQEVNGKIKDTSRLLGLFLLIVYSFKTLLQTVLGESLIFQTIEPFFGYMVLAILFFISSKWEKEIEAYLSETKIKILVLYSKQMENRYSLFLSLPGLCLIILHYYGEKLITWSSRFEFVNLLYARVLRVKFETSRSKDSASGEVSTEYCDQFLKCCDDYIDDHIFETPFYESIESQLDLWIAEKTLEQTVAVYGPKGCGKSVFLDMMKSQVEKKEVDCIKITIPPKVFTEKSFDSLFQEVFETPKSTKKVVLLDNVHNLFLSTIGGFEIYKNFLQKIEATDHIFWIASFNEYSWMFLNSVLGKNQYFRLEERFPRWPMEKIKGLIESVHLKTDFNLVYDEIFMSSQKLQDGVAPAESRYFFLLWERCNGSPGSAIHYWFRSLNSYGQNSLKVCLPRENPINELNNLHQEMHFVYAALFKHENLNVSEGTRATNLPRPVVKQALYRGLEEGFLGYEKGRYDVNLAWNDDLKRFLKGKNLVYEING